MHVSNVIPKELWAWWWWLPPVGPGVKSLPSSTRGTNLPEGAPLGATPRGYTRVGRPPWQAVGADTTEVGAPGLEPSRVAEDFWWEEEGRGCLSRPP